MGIHTLMTQRNKNGIKDMTNNINACEISTEKYFSLDQGRGDRPRYICLRDCVDINALTRMHY